MYLLHVSIFYICLLYQLSLFSSFASSSSSPPPPLPPPSISFPPGCRSLFLRAKFTFRYRARAGWARLANPPPSNHWNTSILHLEINKQWCFMSKMLNPIPMNLLDFIQFFKNLDPARFSGTAIYWTMPPPLTIFSVWASPSVCQVSCRRQGDLTFCMFVSW